MKDLSSSASSCVSCKLILDGISKTMESSRPIAKLSISTNSGASVLISHLLEGQVPDINPHVEIFTHGGRYNVSFQSGFLTALQPCYRMKTRFMTRI